MRRVFWLSVGAAAGYYAARKGQIVVDDARERGLVGNVTWAAATATRVATAAAGASIAVGEALGSRSRHFTSLDAPDHPSRSTSDTDPTSESPNTREVRP